MRMRVHCVEMREREKRKRRRSRVGVNLWTRYTGVFGSFLRVGDEGVLFVSASAKHFRFVVRTTTKKDTLRCETILSRVFTLFASFVPYVFVKIYERVLVNASPNNSLRNTKYSQCTIYIYWPLNYEILGPYRLSPHDSISFEWLWDSICIHSAYIVWDSVVKKEFIFSNKFVER